MNTKWVSGRHKLSLYLYASSVRCKSLFPGLISYLIPNRLDDDMILTLLDLLLAISKKTILEFSRIINLILFLLPLDTPSGFTGVLYVLNSLQFANLHLKVEVAKRLLSTVFTRPNAPGLISQQFGWQTTITKLFVKRSIAPYPPETHFVFTRVIK